MPAMERLLRPGWKIEICDDGEARGSQTLTSAIEYLLRDLL